LFQVSERKLPSWHILILVSGASRCWYAAMQAEEQNCIVTVALNIEAEFFAAVIATQNPR
jgi:hypothetical protein